MKYQREADHINPLQEFIWVLLPLQEKQEEDILLIEEDPDLDLDQEIEKETEIINGVVEEGNFLSLKFN